MSKRYLFASAGVLLLILLAVNLAVSFATRNSIPRQVMARARRFPQAVVEVLGNSLMGAGFDEATFNRTMGLDRNGGSLNLALGGSTPVEQLLLLRYSLQNRIHPRLLLYGFYDFQLTDPISLTTADLIGNRAVLYYLEPEYGRGFYHLSFHDRVEFEIMRQFPMTVDRGAIWAKVERLRREMSRQGMPPEKSNRFGIARDFSLLEAANTAEFVKECNQGATAGLIAPVEELIRQGEDGGAKILFIEMPMPPAHLRAFYETPAWTHYTAHLRALLEPSGVEFLDASHWFGDTSLFADSLHLTEAGAVEFSERLGKFLRDPGRASKSRVDNSLAVR